MEVIVQKHVLESNQLKSNALFFMSKGESQRVIKPAVAIFTHGFTSHKGQLVNWASRLVGGGVNTIIFDLPGHYLGGFNELDSLTQFTKGAYRLFGEAFKLVQDSLGNDEFSVILGGHSLGALFALKAMQLEVFASYRKAVIAVGLGVGEANILNSPIFQSTLDLRNGLVSPHISYDKIFPWVREEKKKISISNERIHLITGSNDYIVGTKGMDNLGDILLKRNNKVTFNFPNDLSHHQPERAARYIWLFVKEFLRF